MASGRISVCEAQQELAYKCGYGTNIFWDLLSSKDANVMWDKIKQLVPDKEKGQSLINEMRQDIFNSVWKQRKYTNNLSVTSIFFVMVTKNKSYSLRSTEYSCHPVFRCKKCQSADCSDTSDYCMIYVDEVGRIYQNWRSYITENVLPPGVMIAPRRGIYNFDNWGKVILESHCTPSGTPEAMAMDKLQSRSAMVGLGAAVVPVAALVMPVAAPIMAAAGIIGMGVGALSAVTSALHLKDRGKHGQSVSLNNRASRACYLGVLGGTVGMAAVGTTRIMTSMASAGKATKPIEVLVNGMNISSIALSGSGVANGFLDLMFKIGDGEEISSMDILQLSTSLILFTHSVNNFQLASQMANNARNNSIRSYRETLSNRQRKMFDKMSKETLRIRGGTQGKMDIIRAVNEIPDRQYLNDLYKINKKLNEQNVRPSFGTSGKNIVLNNEVAVKAGELRQSVQYQQGPNILQQVIEPIPSNHGSETYKTKTPLEIKLFFANNNLSKKLDAAVNESNWQTQMKELAIELKNGAFIMIKEFGKEFSRGITDFSKFQDIIEFIFNNLAEGTAKFLCELTQEFMEICKEMIERRIKMIIKTETVLYKMFDYVVRNYEDLSYKFISQKKDNIIEAIKAHFLCMDSIDPKGRRTVCPDCHGTIIVSQLME